MRRALPLLLSLLLIASLVPGQGKLGGTGKVGGVAKIAVNGGGGETNFVNDTFTEASDVELSTHTAELGGPWVDHPDAAYGDTVTVSGTSDRIFINFSTGAAVYYATATPPSADYCGECVVFVASVVASNVSVGVRWDTTANTGYIFRLNSGTSWDVRRVVTGTQTTLPAATTSTENLPGVGETRTMTLCISGGATPTLTAKVDGSTLATLGGLDGSPITATGKFAVRFSGTGTSSTGFHFVSCRAYTP